MKIIFITFILSITLSTSASEYFVLSTKNINSENIDKKIVKNIFLGNKIYWESGKRILPVHLPISSESFKFFLKDVIDMDSNQFLSYWRRKLFSGRAHPPKQLEKDALIIEFIKSHPDGIGVISKVPKIKNKDIVIIKM
jgi:hypothetical protein